MSKRLCLKRFYNEQVYTNVRGNTGVVNYY